MSPLPLVLGQAPPAFSQPVWHPFVPTEQNPNFAVDALLTLATQYHVLDTLHMIGVSLLALFTLLELYRLWIAGDAQGLPILAVKVLIVNALISVGPGSPVLTTFATVYGYFAQAGQAIVANAAHSDAQEFRKYLEALLATPKLSLWYWLTNWNLMIAVLESILLRVAYWLVLALLFGLYTFAVVSSRMFVVLSIVLMPIIFPLSLWAPLTHSYIGRWLSSTVHALLLPLVAAIALVIGIRMGIMAPLKEVASCAQVMQNVESWMQCNSSMAGAMIEGMIGSLAAILLMIGVDGVVRSFIGGDIFVSALSALASRGAVRLGGHWIASRFHRPARPEQLTVFVEHPIDRGIRAHSWRPPRFSPPGGGGGPGLPPPGGGGPGLPGPGAGGLGLPGPGAGGLGLPGPASVPLLPARRLPPQTEP